ncbi:MAG: hypothetical protein M3Z85_15460, partial [Acidobacteriota bacterium]|nr:hypothetical protein [Acidobacteriota bacterium]
EGIEPLLDNLQKGAVNTVWAYTYDFSEARMTPNGPIPLPDHGRAGGRDFTGGAFYDYDLKYFRNTILKDFRAPDYGKFDVIRDVARKVHARGMDFFCWDYNNAVPIMNRSIPGFSQVAEVDLYGRPTTSPCFNHPDYRAHLTGKIESYLGGYANEVDGIGWGCERMGPLQNAIGGGWTTGVDNLLTGVRQDRPNVLGDPYVRNTKTLVWATPSAFVANPLGMFGNAGYNSLQGPAFFDFEFFNVLNHTNFNLPVSTLSSASFGKIQNAGDPRILQFALKYSF